MINRRALLKAIGLAPAAAAAASLPVKGMANGGLVGAPGEFVFGEMLPLDYADNPAVLMSRLTGLPVNGAMRAYCDEVVSVEPPKAYAITSLPFAHPEF